MMSLSKQDDLYDVFGEYVASELRSLSSDSARKRVKREIQQVIMQTMDEELQLAQLSDMSEVT